MPPKILEIDADAHLPREAGGKALGLELIAKAGFRIPPSWVILPDAPPSQIDALFRELLQRGPALLAVRSSALDEDDLHSSFAGIHLTLLGVGFEKLREALAKVAASTLTDRALAYRRELGLPPPSGPCAVVLQEMIAADSAGVAFGTGEGNDAVVIEAVEGLGDIAVDGRVTPETHTLVKKGGTWRVERSSPRSQDVLTAISGDELSRVKLPEFRHGEVLDPVRAREIAGGIERLQEASGRRLDVEWAWSDDALWLLQARPQTRPLEGGLPPGQVWTRANAREVLPDIPSALSRSSLSLLLDGALRKLSRMYGHRPDPDVPFFTHVLGRPVFNELMFLPGDLLGVSREAGQAEFGGSGEVDDSFREVKLAAALRRPVLLFRALAVVAKAERRAKRTLKRIQTIREEMEAIDIGNIPDHELVNLLFHADRDFWFDVAISIMTVAATVNNAQYFLLRRLRRHPAPRALTAPLVAEGEASVSTLQLEKLVELAESMRRWPEAAHFAASITPDHRSLDFWLQEMPEEVGYMVMDWLERFGHRGPYESDIALPRYREDLTLLARALFPLVKAERFVTKEEQREMRRKEAARAEAEVAKLCGRWGSRRVGRAVKTLKRLTALRERLRSEAVTLYTPARRMGLELGRRLAERGRLRDRDHIWHLSADEIERAVTQPDFDVQVAVARELARRSAWRRIEVPNRFSTEEIPHMAARIEKSNASAETLRGNGISPGIVEGEVRVLMSSMEEQKFEPGAILVAPATDPAWTPIFAGAVGIVVELGGTLSHAGIVAREYGIPCVANIDGVTRILRDGDMVRIDGSQGLVTVLSRTRAGRVS